MTQAVMIRRNGTAIDISADGGRTPLPPAILAAVCDELSYTHVQHLRGHEQWGADGVRRQVETTLKQLYQIDPMGAIITGFGLLTRVVRTLQQFNVQLQYVDMSPARPRPECYVPDWDNLRKNVTFRPKQEECLSLIAQNHCGIIDATMGFGKGELFLMLALLYPHAKFHIVAPGQDIAKSLVRRLSRVFSNVGLIGAGHNYFGTRITVFVAKSMRKSDGDADFLLCDEVHLMAAQTYAYDLGITWRISRNFGFTGTLDMRLDKADKELELLFGPALFKLGYKEAEALGLVTPISVRWLQVDMKPNPCEGMIDTRMMKYGIWTNDVRNRIIADDVKKHYGGPDTQVLILCHSIRHAIHLWQHLPDFELCYGTMSNDELVDYKREGLLPQTFMQMSAKRREELREGFAAGTVKKVSATDVWATGVDFVNLRVLYRVDARASEIIDNQGPGRLSRIAADKSGAVLVDCWDLFDTRFTRKSMTRRSHYKKLGWRMTNVVDRRWAADENQSDRA